MRCAALEWALDRDDRQGVARERLLISETLILSQFRRKEGQKEPTRGIGTTAIVL